MDDVKVSDYLMEKIADVGIDKVFYVSGGGAMHFNDSLGKSKKLQGIAMLHEQGASIAAEAYARSRDGMGACLVTSGPGATNAITGLVGAYIDSIPVIFLSGQAKRLDLRGDSGVRQFGIQEVSIVPMVRKYTKYAVQIRRPEDVRYEFEKAVSVARAGRPGPVWLDVPLDIQASQIHPDELMGCPEANAPIQPTKAQLDRVIQLLNQSEKPLLFLGHGIRLAHAVEKDRQLYEYLGFPVLTSWNGVDLIEDAHPLFFGRPGAVGMRAANFIQQKADCVLSLGTRLCLLNTGYNFAGFLKNAHHIMVDIDRAELMKKSVHPELPIQCDVGKFLSALWERREEINISPRKIWLRWCRDVKKKYPTFIPEQEPAAGCVSNYRLVRAVSDALTEKDLYQFTSSGTTVDIAMKSFQIKWGQRAFLTKGLAAMGYDIPACVGSALGSGRRVACVTGDGSACMNMQELEVIHRFQLPVKLFISDNHGYSMIYQSQTNNFHELTGCNQESGLTLPDLGKIAAAFGLPVYRIDDESNLLEKVKEIVDAPGPAVTIVSTDIQQKILPKQANYMKKDGQMASRPLEDMVPLLDRREMRALMGEEYEK